MRLSSSAAKYGYIARVELQNTGETRVGDFRKMLVRLAAENAEYVGPLFLYYWREENARSSNRLVSIEPAESWGDHRDVDFKPYGDFSPQALVMLHSDFLPERAFRTHALNFWRHSGNEAILNFLAQEVLV